MQIRKVLITCLILYGTLALNVACSNSNVEQPPIKTDSSFIGGWVPIFFNDYDTVKINKIVDLIRKRQLDKIEISYPNSKVTLAKKIAQMVSIDNTIPVTLNAINLTDTKTLKYNHSQVIVTIYFKHKTLL